MSVPDPASETALIVEAPEAEPLVGALRAGLDPSAARGIPAHLTVLYPFEPAGGLEEVGLPTLAELARRTAAFAYRLTAVDEFDDALWLRPSPDGPLRALTESLWSRFPECPPYGGAHDAIVPHLTVAVRGADGRDEARWAAAHRTLDRRLPWSCTATALSVFRTDRSGRWSRIERLAFG